MFNHPRVSSSVFALLTSMPLLLASCGLANTQQRVLLVKHHKQACISVAPTLCWIVRQATENVDWRLLYSPIRGFDYEWGYTYTIVVNVSQVTTPEADGVSLTYSLVEVKSKTKVPEGSEFAVTTAHAQELINKTGTHSYTLANEIGFECSNPICETLSSSLLLDMQNVLTFTYTPNADTPLTLTGVECLRWEATSPQACP